MGHTAAPRTVVIFTSKPRQMSFGGNDAFVVQIIRNWPSKEDRLVFAYNVGHPCEKLFSELKTYATIERLPEELTAARRLDIAAETPHSPWRRRFLEFCDDLARPFRATLCVFRFMHFLDRYHPDVVMLNAGGNPPEDLAWRMMLAAWLVRTRNILLVNHNYPGQGTTMLRRFVLMILRRLTRFFCNALVVPSQHMATIISESMGDARGGIVIPYGFDGVPDKRPSLEEKRKALGITSSLIVGAVGNLEDRKGLHILVKAFPAVLKEFPETQLVLIGFPADPAYAEQLKLLIHTMGLDDKVRNMGYMPAAGQYFECFDVCVVPSIYSEGFGIVSIEAMSYRKPVVAAATGGLVEVLRDGETGYVLPPGDVDALANALLKLLRSPELREEMGRKSLERFNTCYRTERMAERYYQISIDPRH